MDSPILITVSIVVSLLLALLGAGVWIFAAMLVVSIVSLHFLVGLSIPRIGSMVQSVMWRTSTSFELAALPLFVWMAEILFRTNVKKLSFLPIFQTR